MYNLIKFYYNIIVSNHYLERNILFRKFKNFLHEGFHMSFYLREGKEDEGGEYEEYRREVEEVKEENMESIGGR